MFKLVPFFKTRLRYIGVYTSLPGKQYWLGEILSACWSLLQSNGGDPFKALIC